MLQSSEGIYRQGKIVVREVPSNIRDDTPVIVTFLQSDSVDLRSRGMDETQAAELRARLESFALDWDSPEMNIYDHYDAAKAALDAR